MTIQDEGRQTAIAAAQARRVLRTTAAAETAAEQLCDLAECAAAAGQSGAMRHHLDLAVALAGLAPKLLDRAVAIARAGGDLRAAWDFQRLAVQRAGTADAWLMLGGIAGERGRPVAALFCFRHAMRQAPRSVRPWNRIIAVLQAEVGSSAALQAVALAEQRLGARPDLALTRLRLLWETGDMAVADQLLAGEACGDPAQPELAGCRIERALVHGDAGAAQAALAAAAAAQPVWAARMAAWIALAQGQPEAAEAGLDQALTRWPEAQELIGAAAELQVLRGDWPGAFRRLEPLRRNVVRTRQGKRAQRHLLALVDELVVDAALGAEATALRRQGDRAGLSLRMREQPQSLMLALSLLSLGGDAPAETDRIPKCILQYREDPAPGGDAQQLMDSWRQCNPGWDYRLYTRDSALAELGRGDPTARQAFRLAATAEERGAIFRAALLFREGGVWADPRARCLQVLDPLIAGVEVLALCDRMGLVETGLLGCSPGNLMAGRVLLDTVQAVLRRESDTQWLAMGKGAVTRGLAVALAAACLAGRGLPLRRLSPYQARAHVMLDCAAGSAPARHWPGFDAACYFSAEPARA